MGTPSRYCSRSVNQPACPERRNGELSGSGPHPFTARMRLHGFVGGWVCGKAAPQVEAAGEGGIGRPRWAGSTTGALTRAIPGLPRRLTAALDFTWSREGEAEPI